MSFFSAPQAALHPPQTVCPTTKTARESQEMSVRGVTEAQNGRADRERTVLNTAGVYRVGQGGVRGVVVLLELVRDVSLPNAVLTKRASQPQAPLRQSPS